MGRVQLVKSIIYGMLVYSFHVYQWPRKLLKALDRWIKKIIWSGDINNKKVCIGAWRTLCNPWSVGGLDLKSTSLINESLILQLGWKLILEESQWSLFFKRRFLSNESRLLVNLSPQSGPKLNFI